MGAARPMPPPKGTPPWESLCRVLQSRTGSQRSGAAGLSRAEGPGCAAHYDIPAKPGKGPAETGFGGDGGFRLKPAPPGPTRADRHQADASRACIRAGRIGRKKEGTTQHEGSSHRKQGRDDRAAVGRKGPQRPPSRREAAPRAEGGIKTRVSYAGECSLEEAVSQYLAARANSRASGPGRAGA